MPILENDVIEGLKSWLEGQGYAITDVNPGNANGFDIEAVEPHEQRQLIVECKGEAANGDQHARSWVNSATALFKAIWWKANPDMATVNIGVAFPDTPEYHNRLDILRDFCEREGIRVFWVNNDGVVSHW